MSEGLAWPPKKEDLERMYVVGRMSAAKIAKAYGLGVKYKSPKVAESTILYQLKKHGIKRRDSSEHIRKITSDIVDEWEMRYRSGESLKTIAGDTYSPVSVMLHLRKRNVKLRNRVDAQISAVTKYKKSPFSGSKVEEAYLLGFARGDLNVSKHGRSIRLKTATTHPLMIDLLVMLFEPYGHPLVTPRKSQLVGFEWSFQVDLDLSFQFLLTHRKQLPDWVFRSRYFRSFAAGFFDAEGSIWLNETSVHGFEIAFANSDRELLERISSALNKRGLHFHLGVDRNTSVWKLYAWRRPEVNLFLSLIPLRHPEKVSKARIALEFAKEPGPAGYQRVVGKWETKLAEIKAGRDAFVKEAEEAILARNVNTRVGP